MKLPEWFKQNIPNTDLLEERASFFKELRLNTVCQGAHCPNIGDCFSKNQATFMILGSSCTRDCRFCAVENKNPQAIDPFEPQNIREAVSALGLDYVVVTSVTRDDLEDGGAEQFVKTIKAIRDLDSNIKIEVLIPDFKRNTENLKTVINAKPDVVGHNIETVPRLYQKVRPQADYNRSISLLKKVKEFSQDILTKSGLMLGLGEGFSEILECMQDLKDADCDILVLGQYLAPSDRHIPIARFYSPQEFKELESLALLKGFKAVLSGPLVRSSYKAKDIFQQIVSKEVVKCMT